MVEGVLREFLHCGLLEHSFARLWCGGCRRSVLVAFSCRGRSLLPVLREEEAAPLGRAAARRSPADVAHRDVVFTIPRLLRRLFRRRRKLLTELPRAGAEAVQELLRLACGDARPGIVVSVATAGDLLQWHPHLHLIATDAVRGSDRSWCPLPEWDSLWLMTLSRVRLLPRLLDAKAISKELIAKLLAWRHPGFRAHVGRMAAEDKRPLEDTAGYVVRNPLSLRKLVYLDGQQAVLYHSKLNPLLGRNFEAPEPLEWLARMSDHIPDPGQHRTLFHGEYANRVRGRRRLAEPDTSTLPVEPLRERCSPSWARLIAKVYKVDSLLCLRCGKRMPVVAFVTDTFAIRRILHHLELSTPEAERPPPLREVLRVAEHSEGWGVPAGCE